MKAPRGIAVRSLFLKQPWAWAVAMRGVPALAADAKDVENRHWGTPFRGPVLIGASGTMAAGPYPPQLQRLIARAEAGPCPGAAQLAWDARSAVVAVAVLAGVHKEHEGCCRPWGEYTLGAGRHQRHWCWGEVRLLPSPAPCPGHQGLRTPAPGFAAEVLRMVGVDPSTWIR